MSIGGSVTYWIEQQGCVESVEFQCIRLHPDMGYKNGIGSEFAVFAGIYIRRTLYIHHHNITQENIKISVNFC